jgi:hypothetical protein
MSTDAAVDQYEEDRRMDVPCLPGCPGPGGDTDDFFHMCEVVIDKVRITHEGNVEGLFTVSACQTVSSDEVRRFVQLDPGELITDIRLGLYASDVLPRALQRAAAVIRTPRK